jgi:hypothetical protein
MNGIRFINGMKIRRNLIWDVLMQKENEKIKRDAEKTMEYYPFKNLTPTEMMTMFFV